MSVLKKRGRKPLLKNIEGTVQSSTKVCCDSTISNFTFDTPSNETGKSDTTITTTNIENDPHLILHLHIQDSAKNMDHVPFPKESFENSFFKYSPSIDEPVAYEHATMDSYPEECEFTKCTDTENNSNIKTNTSIKHLFTQNKSQQEQVSSITNVKDNKTSSTINTILLKELIHTSQWSHLTDYWCQWDCHPFDTQPVGLPVKYKNGKFLVVGCFCSLECAVSYNFYGNETLYNSWENYNLINMLSNSVGYKSVVNPALSRKCLQVFGGALDIKTFRKKSMINKQYKILQYPMVSLVEHVEEINETIPYQKNMAYIPIEKLRADKMGEINDKNHGKKKSTLEEKMSLKFTN